MDKTRLGQHIWEYRSSPPTRTLPGLGWPSPRLQVDRLSRIPSRSRVKGEMVELLQKIHNLTAIHQSNCVLPTSPFIERRNYYPVRAWNESSLCSQLFYLKNKTISCKNQIFSVCSTCFSTHSQGSQMKFDNLHTGVFHFHVLEFPRVWNETLEEASDKLPWNKHAEVTGKKITIKPVPICKFYFQWFVSKRELTGVT